MAAAMVGGAVEHQQDVLPSKLSRQHVEERLEARRIECRHDQIDAGAVLGGDRAMYRDVWAHIPESSGTDTALLLVAVSCAKAEITAAPAKTVAVTIVRRLMYVSHGNGRASAELGENRTRR